MMHGPINIRYLNCILYPGYNLNSLYRPCSYTVKKKCFFSHNAALCRRRPNYLCKVLLKGSDTRTHNMCWLFALVNEFRTEVMKDATTIRSPCALSAEILNVKHMPTCVPPWFKLPYEPLSLLPASGCQSCCWQMPQALIFKHVYSGINFDWKWSRDPSKSKMSLLHLHEVAYFVEQKYYCELDVYFADKKSYFVRFQATVTA